MTILSILLALAAVALVLAQRFRRERLSEDVRLALAEPIKDDMMGRTAFEVAKCSHCGGVHMHTCPRVKNLVFNGSVIAAVEFWPDGKWSREHVIWPWQVFKSPPPQQPPVPELTSSAS